MCAWVFQENILFTATTGSSYAQGQPESLDSVRSVLCISLHLCVNRSRNVRPPCNPKPRARRRRCACVNRSRTEAARHAQARRSRWLADACCCFPLLSGIPFFFSFYSWEGELLAETVVKLPQRLVENSLIRALLAEAWDTCQ